MLNHGLQGNIDIAIVKTVDPEKFRGEVKLMSTGGVQKCVMNPSPFGGHMPTEGSMVIVYTKPGWGTRHLITLSEAIPTDSEDEDEGRSIEQRLEDAFEEAPGDVEYLDTGESFFGHKTSGRLRMDNQGTATMYSRKKNLSLELNQKINRASLVANDFTLSTHGQGIRIRTKGSLPATFGDTIRIEKNVSTVTIPESISGVDPVLSSISYFEIDDVGGMTLSATVGAAKLSLSGDGLIGDIRLENTPCKLLMDSFGDINLFGPLCSLEMGVDASLLLSNKVGSLTISKTGEMTLTSSKDMVLSSFSTITASSSSDILLTTPKNATMTGTAQVALNGALIKLGELATTHAALAEPIALIVTAIAALNAVVITHTHPVATTGSPSAHTGTAAQSIELATASGNPAMALALASATPAQVGSQTVTVQV